MNALKSQAQASSGGGGGSTPDWRVMGGENSAFKAPDRMSETSEEINVTDSEDESRHGSETSAGPIQQGPPPPALPPRAGIPQAFNTPADLRQTIENWRESSMRAEPLQLTKYDRDRAL